MAEIVRTYDLQVAKKQIKEFSETEPNFQAIDRVKTKDEGFFWDSTHQVTGEELNKLNRQVSTNLNEQSNHIVKLYKEFGEVFNAIEALDKDYITGILGALTSAEQAIKENDNTINQVKDTQERLSRNQEALGKLVKSLSGIKEELQVKITELESSVSMIEKKLSTSETSTKSIPTNAESVKQSNTLPVTCAVISIVAVAADIALRVLGIL